MMDFAAFIAFTLFLFPFLALFTVAAVKMVKGRGE